MEEASMPSAAGRPSHMSPAQPPLRLQGRSSSLRISRQSLHQDEHLLRLKDKLTRLQHSRQLQEAQANTQIHSIRTRLTASQDQNLLLQKATIELQNEIHIWKAKALQLNDQLQTALSLPQQVPITPNQQEVPSKGETSLLEEKLHHATEQLSQCKEKHAEEKQRGVLLQERMSQIVQSYDNEKNNKELLKQRLEALEEQFQKESLIGNLKREKLKSLLDGQTASIARLTSQNSQLTSQNSQLTSQNSQLTSQRQSLQNSAALLQERTDKLKEENSFLRQSVAKIEGLNQKMHCESVSLRSECASLQTELQRERRQRESAREAATLFAKQLQSMHTTSTTLMSLEAHCNTLKEQLANEQRARRELKEIISEKEQRIKEEADCHHRASTELAELRGVLRLKEGEVRTVSTQLQRQLSGRQADQETTKQELSFLKAEIVRLDQQYTLKIQQASLRKEMDISDLKKSHEVNINSMAAEMEIEFQTIQKQYDSQMSYYRDQERAFKEQLEKERSLGSTEASRLHLKIENLEQQALKGQLQLKSVIEENKALSQRLGHLNEENRSLHSQATKVLQVSENRGSLWEQNRRLEMQIQEHMERNKGLLAQCHSIAEDCRILSEQNAKLQRERRQFQRQMSELDLSMRQLASQLADSNAQNRQAQFDQSAHKRCGTDIRELKGAVTSLRSDLTKCETAVSEKEALVKKLESEREVEAGIRRQLEDQVHTLTTQNRLLTGQLDHHAQSKFKYQSNSEEKTTEVLRLKKELATLQRDTDRRAADLKEQVHTLQTKINNNSLAEAQHLLCLKRFDEKTIKQEGEIAGLKTMKKELTMEVEQLRSKALTLRGELEAQKDAVVQWKSQSQGLQLRTTQLERDLDQLKQDRMDSQRRLGSQIAHYKSLAKDCPACGDSRSRQKEFLKMQRLPEGQFYQVLADEMTAAGERRRKLEAEVGALRKQVTRVQDSLDATQEKYKKYKAMVVKNKQRTQEQQQLMSNNNRFTEQILSHCQEIIAKDLMKVVRR